MSLLSRALELENTSSDTPLAKAVRDAHRMREAGVKLNDYHRHVGENGVRCEFCGDPVWYEKHDPSRCTNA